MRAGTGRWRQTLPVAALIAAAVAGCGGGKPSQPPASGTGSKETALQAVATAFLHRYVTSDGRVLRHDQGNDIVSEGQAYGMLIAEVAGQPAIARTIWTWTAAHLMRSDGLLSFHADASGHLLDANSATDADVLAAYALLRLRGPQQSTLHEAGRRLAASVLTHETATVGPGEPVPTAGSWAAGPPVVVDPSYWMPAVYVDLARLTGDARWRQAASTTVRLLGEATHNGRTLPPDWGHISGGQLVAAPAPDGSAGIQYGLDAQRLPLWFDAGCSTQAQSLAAAWWKLLSPDHRSAAIALTLDGTVVNSATNPLPLLAAAAAARAAGDAQAARRLTDQAVAAARATPTYYGDAWLVFSRALVQHQLTGCG